MVDKVSIEGNYPDGSGFRFNLDGASTYDQMQRLIELTGKVAAKSAGTDPEEKQRIAALAAGTIQYNRNNAAAAQATSSLGNFGERLHDVGAAGSLLKGNFSGLTGALRSINHPLSLLGTAASGLVGSLMGYAESLRPALQRGIGGAVMDFAIYAKSAGLNMDQFTKALASTEGAFTMLGATQNEAAKNFSGLINSVRKTTAEFGNLGMGNEELAKFTSEQLKIAVQQGVRGRAAQERVISVSRSLGAELQELAQRTGKTTAELAAMATKLVTDPTISNFIATLSSGGDKVSKAMQKFGSTMGSLFGKQGEELANVAARTAVSGLPMYAEEMGMQIKRIMPAYGDALQEMSMKAAQGIEPTEADRRRLKEIFEEEYKQRQKIIQLMGINGSAEDKAAAARVEAMYQQSRMYDESETKRRSQAADAAQKFNSQVNELTATFHQLMVPLLNMLNSVDWNAMFDVLNGMAKGVKFLLDNAINPLARALGDSGAGTVVGALLGLATVAGLVGTAFTVLRGGVLSLAKLIAEVVAWGSGTLRRTPGGGAPGGRPGAPTPGSPTTPPGPSKPSGGAAPEVSKTTGFGRLSEAETEIAARRAAERQARIDRAADLRKQNPGMTAREAMEAARKEQTIANTGPQPAGTPPAAPTQATIGARMLDILKGWGPMLAGIGGMWLGGKISEAGEETLKEDPESTMGKLQVATGEAVSFLSTWGGLLGQLAMSFPEVGEKIKSLGSAAWTVAKEAFPKLVSSIGSFSSGIGSWITKISGAIGPLLPILLRFAGVVGLIIGAFQVIDMAAGWLAKKFGVDTSEISKEQKAQDEQNWEKMNWWQKIESGAARGIEKVFDIFGMETIKNAAERARLRDETEYFAKKELEGTTTNAATTREKAEKEQVDQLKILNQHMEDLKDEAKVGNIMSNRQVMSAEAHEKFLRILSAKPN